MFHKMISLCLAAALLGSHSPASAAASTGETREAKTAQAADAAAFATRLEIAAQGLEAIGDTNLGMAAGGKVNILAVTSNNLKKQMLGSLFVGNGAVLSLAGTHYFLKVFPNAFKSGATFTAKRAALVSAAVAFVGYLEIGAGLLLFSTSDAQAGVIAPSLPRDYYLVAQDWDVPTFDNHPTQGGVGINRRLANLFQALSALSTSDLLELDQQLQAMADARIAFPDYFLLRGYIAKILARPDRTDEEGRPMDLSWQEGFLADEFNDWKKRGLIDLLQRQAAAKLEALQNSGRSTPSNALFLDLIFF